MLRDIDVYLNFIGTNDPYYWKCLSPQLAVSPEGGMGHTSSHRTRTGSLLVNLITLLFANLSHFIAWAMRIVLLQWNLCIVDTAGTQLAVLYREVSLVQR